MRGGSAAMRRPSPRLTLRATASSEGFEEGDELPLLRRGEQLVVVDERRGLARVAQDGLAEGQREAVVHQPRARPHAPERRRTHLLARRLAAVLHDVVARADVVQQEVAERADDLTAERDGHAERAAV